jgi:ATP/maltotriose-dependent transcriptional regulator MalT/DNA-binding SARP family transcriptional activator
MADVLSNIQLPQPRKNWVRRQRALDLLYASLDSRLILVVAGPGYGKTGLLAQFAKIQDFAFSWLTLDEREQDLRAFGEALVASIQQCFPGFGQQTLQLLSSAAAIEQNVYLLVRTFVRELGAYLAQPTCIVLDDFHNIETSQPVTEFINRLIMDLPDDAHLIIASRNLPPLQLGILIAQQQVSALGQSILRLDQDETRQLLASLNGTQESTVAEEAERAYAATEGWLVGVLMTNHIERMRKQEIGLGAPRALDLLADYLLVRVLQGLPQPLQEFLLRSSVPDEISISFCSKEIGWADTEARVMEVERRNLFLQPIGNPSAEGAGEIVYRYHPLFRQFLLQRLREDDPIRFAQLQHDTGTAYERTNNVVLAVRHFLTGGWSDDALRLIEVHAPDMLQRGHFRTVLDWISRLDALAPNARRDRHLLWQYEILANLNMGQDAQAMAAVDKLDDLYLRMGDLGRRDGLNIRRALLLWRANNFEQALASTNIVIHSIYPQPLWAQMEAHRIAAMCLDDLGRLSEALETITQAERLTQTMGRTGYDALARVKLTRTSILDSMGDTAGALRAAAEALSLAEQINDEALKAEALIQMCEQLLYNNTREGLLEMARQSLDSAETSGNQILRINGLTLLELVLMSQDKVEEALQAGSNALSLARQITRAIERSGALFQILITQAQTLCRCATHNNDGDGQQTTMLQQALALTREAVAIADASQSTRLRMQAYTRLGAVQAAQGDLDLADQTLKFAEATRGEMNSNSVGQMLIWRVLTTWQQKKPDYSQLQFLVNQLAQLIEMRHQDYCVREEGETAWQLYQDLHNAQDLVELKRLEREQLGQGLRPLPPIRPATAPPQIMLVHHDLRILGFGQGQVWRGNHLITPAEWGWNIPRELFFYILTIHQAPRSQITLALWPDSPAASVVSSFHSAKLAIKKALQRQAMVHINGQYVLDPQLDYLYDVSNFEQLISESERQLPATALEKLIEACSLYKGDFLLDSTRDWADEVRRDLQKKYFASCLNAGRHALTLGTPEVVLDVLEDAVRRDELNEEMVRMLITVQWKLGKRSAAFDSYARLKEALQQEMGIPPDDQTEQLILQLRGE